MGPREPLGLPVWGLDWEGKKARLRMGLFIPLFPDSFAPSPVSTLHTCRGWGGEEADTSETKEGPEQERRVLDAQKVEELMVWGAEVAALGRDKTSWASRRNRGHSGWRDQEGAWSEVFRVAGAQEEGREE